MSIGERIKKVRQSKDLTQQEFCEQIGLKRNSISLVESGKRNISDQAIKSICREFNVSETWLRTGEGEMFVPKEADALDELAKQYNLSAGDYVLIEKFLKLRPAERQAVITYMQDVVSTLNATPDTAGQEQTQDASGQEQVEVAETQIMPTPGDGDGLEAQKKQLMEYLDMMNPGQLQMYYDQMRKLKKPQREASPLSAPAEADKNAPGFDPSDLA